MSQKLKQQGTIMVPMLSRVLGPLKYVKSETRTNPNSGEVKTTITFFSEEQLDQYMVTVPGDPMKENAELKSIVKGTSVDFKNCEYGHRADLIKGWQGALNPVVYDICTAESMVLANAQTNQNQPQKPVNK